MPYSNAAAMPYSLTPGAVTAMQCRTAAEAIAADAPIMAASDGLFIIRMACSSGRRAVTRPDASNAGFSTADNVAAWWDETRSVSYMMWVEVEFAIARRRRGIWRGWCERGREGGKADLGVRLGACLEIQLSADRDKDSSDHMIRASGRQVILNTVYMRILLVAA